MSHKRKNFKNRFTWYKKMYSVLLFSLNCSVVNSNTLNLDPDPDPDPGFWPDLDPDPGLHYRTYHFGKKNLKKM